MSKYVVRQIWRVVWLIMWYFTCFKTFNNIVVRFILLRFSGIYQVLVF